MKALRLLIIVGVLLALGGFTSNILGETLGPIEYKGYLVFEYPEGEEPIVSIVFHINPRLADYLIILNTPSPWSHRYEEGTLILSGGSVNPGGSVIVTVSLNKYVKEDGYPMSSVGMTSSGEVSQAVGPLQVGNLYLLSLLGIVSAFRYPLAGTVAGLTLLDLFLSRSAQLGKKSFSEATGLKMEPDPVEYRSEGEDEIARNIPLTRVPTAQDLTQEWEKYLLKLHKRFSPEFERRLMLIFSDSKFLAPFEHHVKNYIRGTEKDVERLKLRAQGERFGEDFIESLIILLDNEENAKELLKYIEHFADEFTRRYNE